MTTLPAVPTRAPVLDMEALALDVWSSFPDDPKNAPTIIRLLQAGAAKVADEINGEISVEHVLAHRVELEEVNKDTGEVSRVLADRIVLVEPDGTAYACVSTGVRKSLQYLMHYYGMPPWKPALKVKVEQLTTRRGFRTFILSPVARA